MLRCASKKLHRQGDMQCQRVHENIRYDWSIGSLSLISPFPAELVMHIEFVTDTYPPRYQWGGENIVLSGDMLEG